MKQAPDIRFVGMEPSDAFTSAALEKANKLELFCPSIIACRVTTKLAHKHRRQGRPFSVHVDLTLPGHELVASKSEHEDAYVALRDAFDDMKRQLEDVMRRMQAQEKRPEITVRNAADSGRKRTGE